MAFTGASDFYAQYSAQNNEENVLQAMLILHELIPKWILLLFSCKQGTKLYLNRDKLTCACSTATVLNL
jgi:hypothetical protein